MKIEKNRLFKVALIIVSLLSFISCVTYHFSPIPDSSITIRRERNNVLPMYQDSILSTIIVPKYIEGHLALQIIVRNNSKNVITLHDSDIQVFSSPDSITYNNLDTFTSEQFYKSKQTKHNVGLVFMAISAGINAATAGQGSSNTQGTFRGSTNQGYFSGTYSSNTRYYDPTAAELARQNNQRNIENYSNSGQAWLDFLSENLFYSIDLLPGQEYSGIVFSKHNRDSFYRVVLNASHKRIVFNYNQFTQ